MARTGPNQDINDPTTIVDLAYQYQQSSDEFGILLAKSNTENPDASGLPIVNVSIPFKMVNGSTQFILGSSIDFDSGYIYDTALVSNATILTYIDLAERFREYWELLRSSLLLLNNFETLDESSVDEIPPTGMPGSLTGYTSGSLGGTQFELETTSFSVDVIDTPTWFGYGPTNYNQNTYPQLLSELDQLQGSANSVSQLIDEVYYWVDVKQETTLHPITLNTLIVAGNIFARVSPSVAFTEAIQIPNFSDTESKTVNLTGSTSYVRTASSTNPSDIFTSVDEGISIESRVAIDEHNTDLSSLSPVVESDSDEIVSGFYAPPDSVSISVSHDREIIIPPNKSAFIIFISQCRGELTISPKPGSMTGTSSITITTDDFTKNRSTSASISF